MVCDYKQWYNNKRRRYIYLKGNCCTRCLCHEYDQLELAHIKDTNLSGEGRGSHNRLRDYRNNPDCYIILCKKCHIEYDAQK